MGLLVGACICWATFTPRAEAVIITGTSGNNTAAPADVALAVRWGQVGVFRPNWGDAFLGTPISSNVFITAKHIAGAVGDKFTSADGTQYTTVAQFADTSSDLALWQISGTFPQSQIVPLYSGAIAANAPMYIFGLGTLRGTEVFGDAFTGGTELKGWRWGTYDGANPVKSWGTNEFAGFYSGGGAGTQIGYSFSPDVSPNEGMLSYGDSGGPVFIQKNGVWSLAGINYAAQTSFRTTGTGATFNAAIFDTGGLYESGTGGTWVYNTPTAVPDPAFAYSTSTVARINWINQTVASVPEPGTIGLLGIAAVCLPLMRGMIPPKRRVVPRKPG